MLLVVSACSSIDCPLNNKVEMRYAFSEKMNDTLSIFTKNSKGADTLLVNRLVGSDSLYLPISHQNEVDELYFKRTNTALAQTIDTVKIAKQNIPHFESVDCGVIFFHRISSVSTTHHGIDSLVINQPHVTYDASKPHIIIYFKPFIR